MEYVPGRTLKQVLKEDGPLTEDLAVRYMHQVAAGLRAAHGKGIVHRDVKPENIMLDAHDQAKLGDLGLAKPIVGKDIDFS